MDTAVHQNPSETVPVRPDSSVANDTSTEKSRKVAPVFELLCLCARTARTPAERGRLRRLIEEHDVPWRKLAIIAEIHGIRPLVFHGLDEAAADLLPDGLIQSIQQYRRTTQIHNTFLVNELGRLFDEFRARDIPALALKGPALAQVAYGSIHLRRFVDLDVLIPPRHFATVEAMLLEGDYQPFPKVRNLKGIRKKLYLYLSAQWPFVRGNGIFNLDLHTHVMPPGYTFPRTFEPFWERSRLVEWVGT